MTTTTPHLFHCLSYADADQGLAFLTQLGFVEVLVVRNDNDPTAIEHAELRWRDNGGLMLGSLRHDVPAGQARCYLVVPTDADVDSAYSQALAAGARSIEAPTDQPYGGRVTTVADPEGNQWSIGSYAGQ